MGESDVLNSMVRGKDESVISTPGTPWWVSVLFRAVAVLGIPGMVLCYYMYKDYHYEERRLKVEELRNATQEKTNVLLERFEKVLWRVEKKLPSDGG
jgi:hypothetical protein